MSTTNKKETKVTLSYTEYQNVMNTINPLKRTEQGIMRTQSEFSKQKGKKGVAIYFLKNDLKGAFVPIEEKVEDLQNNYKEDNKENIEKNTDLLRKIQETKDAISKETVAKKTKELKEKLQELEVEQKECQEILMEKSLEVNEEIEKLGEEEVEVTLTRGKLPEEVADHLDSDQLEIFKDLIEFE